MQVVEMFTSKTTLFIVLSLSVIINVVLLYKVFDTAISLDYARAEQSALKKRTLQAQVILSDIASGSSREEILEIADNLSKQGLIVKEHPNEVKVGDIVFKFKGENLSSVEYIQ
jgi:uncharacterized Fe-S cluster-containing protein